LERLLTGKTESKKGRWLRKGAKPTFKVSWRTLRMVTEASQWKPVVVQEGEAHKEWGRRRVVT